MKIPDIHQFRAWDAFTIRHEPIASIDLMERAAQQCSQWIISHIEATHFCVLAGTGNNGGDGLAIARLLHLAGKTLRIIVAGEKEKASPDFLINLERLSAFPSVAIQFYSIFTEEIIGQSEEWFIDALFGTGLNQPPTGDKARWIQSLALFHRRVISIDLPSGMNGDLISPQEEPVVNARHTLTFQSPKRSFFFPENEKYLGEIVTLDIGLHPDFSASIASTIHATTAKEASQFFHTRKKFTHKYQFGHLQVIAGSTGKMGSAILCAHAALRSGCGLVTAHLPSDGIAIMQTAIPEVMCVADNRTDYLQTTCADNRKSAIAIGPGIGLQNGTVRMLKKILAETTRPLAMDADALNIIAANHLMEKIPAHTILTPHAGEFDRLFGTHPNTFERIKTQSEAASKYGLIIVLKGAYTSVALPDGKIFFNTSGNPGMATAGSGDVLTGMIGGLLAQGYAAQDAAIAGVYLHGLAGDFAVEKTGQTGMIASDMIRAIPAATTFLLLNKKLQR